MNSKKEKKGQTRRPKGHGEITQGNSYRQCPGSVQIQKHKMFYIASRLGSKEELRDTKTNQDEITVCEYSSRPASILKTCPVGGFVPIRSRYISKELAHGTRGERKHCL